jgi:3-hydroxybutyryl-CoA dehydrogenase
VALTVAIIGAGPLGRWLAQETAHAGVHVLLEDVMPHNLQHAQEALRQALGPEAMSTVVFSPTIEEAVRSADLVIDCVPDELESKLEILWLLDRMTPPRTVLATPTTRLSISDLAACTYRPDKVVAVAVEAASLVAGAGREILIRTTARTTPETVALVDEFWRSLKFTPSFNIEGE